MALIEDIIIVMDVAHILISLYVFSYIKLNVDFGIDIVVVTPKNNIEWALLQYPFLFSHMFINHTRSGLNIHVVSNT